MYNICTCSGFFCSCKTVRSVSYHKLKKKSIAHYSCNIKALCKMLKEHGCTSGAENIRTHAEFEALSARSLLRVLCHEACLLRASLALCQLIVHLLWRQWRSCCFSALGSVSFRAPSPNQKPAMISTVYCKTTGVTVLLCFWHGVFKIKQNKWKQMATKYIWEIYYILCKKSIVLLL